MTRGRKFAGIVAVVAAGLVLAGCGANTRDLEGVPIKDPDKIEIYANLDQHPNVVRLCIGGVAFYTTTRDFNAIGRVPEWDTWCGGTATK